MQSPLRRLIFALAFALGIGAAALAKTNTVPDDPPGGKPPAGAPPGFVAPADPKPDESNARNRSPATTRRSGAACASPATRRDSRPYPTTKALR